MEFIIVPQLILALSLFGVLLILGRNFSGFRKVYEEGERDKNLNETMERIKNEEEKFKYLCRRLAERINLRVARGKYKRLSGAAHIKLEKILRKTRIGFLKLDNKFIALIEKLRKRKERENHPPLTSPEREITAPSFPPRKDEARQEGNNQEENKEIPPVTPFNKRGKFEEGNNHSENKPASVPSSFIKKGVKEEEYLEAIGGDPKNMDAYWKLGILYSRKRNYRDALACFKQVVKIKPDYGKAKKKIKDLSEKMRGK